MDVINLSRWEMYRRQPARNVDLFRRVCPVIHAPRDANDNLVSWQVKQRIFPESDKTRVVAVEPGNRARCPQNLPC
jgi:hypothetical protein